VNGNTPARRAEDQHGRGIDSRYPPKGLLSLPFVGGIGKVSSRTDEFLACIGVGEISVVGGQDFIFARKK